MLVSIYKPLLAFQSTQRLPRYEKNTKTVYSRSGFLSLSSFDFALSLRAISPILSRIRAFGRFKSSLSNGKRGCMLVSRFATFFSLEHVRAPDEHENLEWFRKNIQSIRLFLGCENEYIKILIPVRPVHEYYW